MLKIQEISNWLKAWMFMEGCGLADSDQEDDAEYEEEAEGIGEKGDDFDS